MGGLGLQNGSGESQVLPLQEKGGEGGGGHKKFRFSHIVASPSPDYNDRSLKGG